MPADFLSRNVVEPIQMSDEEFSDQQSEDPFCQALKQAMYNL